MRARIVFRPPIDIRTGSNILTFAGSKAGFKFRCICIVLTLVSTGCHKELLDRPLLEQYELQKDDIYYKSDPRPLRYYNDYATGIEYPTECHLPESGVLRSYAPRTISARRNDEVWNLSLARAIELALQNNEIVRDDLQFRSLGNSLLANPQRTPSIYDPAIQETGVLFGNRGVEAALADFDTRFTTRLTLGRSEVPQNSNFLNLPAGASLTDETGQFSSRLEKNFATGGTFSLQHDVNYSLNNVPLGASKLFNSAYTSFFQAEYRRPLMAGAGSKFTRIAGPISNTLTGVSGVSQGVVISKINTDIAIADFELTIVNLVKNLEDRYWDLYLAYQVFDSEIEALNDSKRNLEEVKLKIESGQAGINAVAEYQALKNFKDSELRVFGSLADIYEAEQRLRRLIGMQVNDGRIIRPSDEPTVAEFVPDWHMSLAEALARRIELRRHKWTIKSLEQQLWAARRLVKPRLDLILNYRVNGLGDSLVGGSNEVYDSITHNDNTSWTAGLDMSMPLGFRSAHSQVQNYELRLSKARKTYAFQEMDVSHELAASFQQLDRWLYLANRNLDRQRAIEDQIDTINIENESGADRNSPEAIDLLQRANIELRDSKIAYYRSMIEYNKAITEIHFRKGTLLDHNNIHLREGLWKAAAYKDAMRRAWERSYADDAPNLRMEPMGFISRYGHPDPLPEVSPASRLPDLNSTPQPYMPPESPADRTPPKQDNDGPVDLPTPDLKDPVPEPSEVDDVARPNQPRRNVSRRDIYLQRSSYTTAGNAGSKSAIKPAGKIRMTAPAKAPVGNLPSSRKNTRTTVRQPALSSTNPKRQNTVSVQAVASAPRTPRTVVRQSKSTTVQAHPKFVGPGVANSAANNSAANQPSANRPGVSKRTVAKPNQPNFGKPSSEKLKVELPKIDKLKRLPVKRPNQDRVLWDDLDE